MIRKSKISNENRNSGFKTLIKFEISVFPLSLIFYHTQINFIKNYIYFILKSHTTTWHTRTREWSGPKIKNKINNIF